MALSPVMQTPGATFSCTNNQPLPLSPSPDYPGIGEEIELIKELLH
jgi:hypothetical protein